MNETRGIKVGMCIVVTMSLIAAVPVGGHAKTVAEEIEGLKATIASNSVNRTTRCRYYKAWYLDLCTEAEREAILERNVAAHRRWIELKPDDISARAGLGVALLVGGRWEEAEKELAAAAGIKTMHSGKADVLWNLADCLWRKGDIAGAKKIITEMAEAKWHGGTPRSLEAARFLYRSWTDPDADIDVYALPHSIDCRPFPTPREAEYGKQKVSLAKVEVRFGTNGTKGAEDPIIRLLKRKLTRFGSKFEKGGTQVEIEIAPDAPVDKPQGYSLDVANGVVSIKARDWLGATSGVVSLMQCGERRVGKDEGQPRVRECTIRDWPECLRRGEIVYWSPNQLEAELFEKVSSVLVDINTRKWDVLFSPLEHERYRQITKRYRDFGIEFYLSERSLSVSPVPPITAPRVREMHIAMLRFAASLGVYGSYEMDDDRFPMRPLDIQNAGTAANLDAKHMTALYREVKKEYPGFRMLFGPPFYWGPDGDASYYPEPREPYLKSIGEFLDPEIDVYWTGPRVKSNYFTPEKIDWFANLVGRKPCVFHNGDCVWRHNYLQYGGDVSGYKKNHSPETFKHVAALWQNTCGYDRLTKGSCMDWCWNPDAHDAETAARRAVEQLEGPGVFEILHMAIPSVEYFDKYAYGQPRSEVFSEDLTDLERRLRDAEDAWNRVLSVAKNGGHFVGGFLDHAISYARRIVNARRNPSKDLIEKHKAAMANTAFAANEIGFDESKGDQFFPAEALVGGKYWRGIGDSTDRKQCNPKELKEGEAVSGKFKCELYPPERRFKMFVTGMHFVDVWEKPFKVDLPDMEIEVNGHVIYRGKMFEEDVFKPFEVEIPVEAMSWNNTFSVRCAGAGQEHKRRPMIHYVVIRK